MLEGGALPSFHIVRVRALFEILSPMLVLFPSSGLVYARSCV
jgi:hypothetical protein